MRFLSFKLLSFSGRQLALLNHEVRSETYLTRVPARKREKLLAAFIHPPQ
jgi:hypothetical protein